MSTGCTGVYARVHDEARIAMMRDDRGWFLAHPGEVERLRDPMPHEFCPRDDECRPLAHPDFVLVREVVPGLRYRLPMTIDTTAVVS